MRRFVSSYVVPFALAACSEFGPDRFILPASASAPDEVRAFQPFLIHFSGSAGDNCWRLDRIEPFASDSTYDVKFIAVRDGTNCGIEALLVMSFTEQITLIRPGKFIIRVAQPDGSVKQTQITVLPGTPGSESR